jgi:hypothetical protein
LSQTDPQDPNFTGTYSTVIGIHRAADGSVILVTTTDVFIVKSPTNITRLPSSSKELLNMTSSSYDAATNKLYFLATYNNGIYFYDLGKPGNAPEELIKVPLAVNRITSGGGKVAVLFDDVPSLEPSVIDAYAATRQLSPKQQERLPSSFPIGRAPANSLCRAMAATFCLRKNLRFWQRYLIYRQMIR